MTINYVGMQKDYEFRLAEIHLGEGQEERYIANRMIDLLNIKGYDATEGVEGIITVPVEDKAEYKQFVNVYKEVKKCIKDCIKYGF